MFGNAGRAANKRILTRLRASIARRTEAPDLAGTRHVDPLAIARSSILAPVGLDRHRPRPPDRRLHSPAIDAADIYFQASRLQSWVLEDGIIKDGNFNIEQGAGVRAIAGEKTGFAYSDELQFPALEQAAVAARAIAGGGHEGRCRSTTPPLVKRSTSR
jgi:TldD protein